MQRSHWLCLLCLLSVPALALEPEQLLLITNRNIADGKALAEYYANKRGVPKGRILELNLPITEEMPFAAYESEVVPRVREFLAKNQLTDQVKCLVTFYGVPLRIGARVNTPADKAELVALKGELGTAAEQIAALVRDAEALALEDDPAFVARPGQTLDALSIRSSIALKRLVVAMGKINDPAKRQAYTDRIRPIVGPLIGEAPAAERRMQDLLRIGNEWTPEQKQEAFALRDRLNQMRARYDDLQARRSDPDARAQLKALVKAELSILEYGKLLEGLIDYLNTDNTDAALDSELALVLWNFYPRVNSLPNPLNYKVHLKGVPPVLMTMRLDGPNGGAVRDMIIGALKAEEQGLSGTVVLDSGGHLALDPNNPSYVAYDKSIKDLAQLLRDKTRLPLIHDQKKEILPANSVKNVALYCGWYSVRSYVPACTFNPGAVGFHVASYELVSLRNEGETGWCRGLISDGVSSTMGAVAEPYLSAFPGADEFFPLLLTGELSLAEAYWRTLPTVSWRVSTLGDPLYRPFGKRPALKWEDLPGPLGANVARPATRPSTRPSR